MSTGRLQSGMARRSWSPRHAERGVALLSVLLMLTLITFVTVAVMAIVQGDLAAGIRQQQAVQVFNIAESGMHYAIARLQTSGADTYTGETVPVADGSTSLGQAQVTVECLDRTSPAVNSCAGPNAGYRRIRSTGTLTVSGPVRLVTAVVEGTTSSTGHYAACAYHGIDLQQGVQIYGDVGSEESITLARGGNPTKICDSNPGGACGSNPTWPTPVPYSGSAHAVGTITCGGGACNSTQIEGTIAPNQPAQSVCPPMTLTPPSSPGTTALPVPAATTTTLDPSVNYGAVTLASTGTGGSCPANVNQRATLVIPSGSDPNATVTVRMRTLWLGTCSRLVISGVGKVVLWILEPTFQGLKAEQNAAFGACQSPPPASGCTSDGTAVTGDRLTVDVMSTAQLTATSGCIVSDSTCPAVKINQAGLLSGTFFVPNGYAGLEMNQSGTVAASGAMLAGQIRFDRNSTYVWDPNSRIGGGVYANFNQLKAWKDQ